MSSDITEPDETSSTAEIAAPLVIVPSAGEIQHIDADNLRFLADMTLGELYAQIPNIVRASTALEAGSIPQLDADELARLINALRAYELVYAILEEMEAFDPSDRMPRYQRERIERIVSALATQTDPPSPSADTEA